jgi:hypothetical protein
MFKKRPILLAVFLMLFAGVMFISNMNEPWFQAIRTVHLIKLTGIGASFGMGLMLLLVLLFPE